MVNFVIGVLIGAVIYALYRINELRQDVWALKVQNLLLAERTLPPKHEISPPKSAEESKVAPESIEPTIMEGQETQTVRSRPLPITEEKETRPGSLQQALSKLSNPRGQGLVRHLAAEL